MKLRWQDKSYYRVYTRHVSITNDVIRVAKLIPEIIFLDAISLRTFENYTLDYDIVFSPMFILTHKNCLSQR